MDINGYLDNKVEHIKELFSGRLSEEGVKAGQRFLNDLNDIIVIADIKEHSQNVAKYTLMIYQNLPLYEKSKYNFAESHVYYAGYYHDIGKAMIIKCFPEMLNKEAFAQQDKTAIKEHTHFGAVLLYWFASAEDYSITEPLFSLLLDSCLYHHERYDGTGYLGLREEHIPFIGQIVAVADCYSAGIEKRVYSDAKESIDMIEELKEMPLNQVYVNVLDEALRKEKGLKDKQNKEQPTANEKDKAV